MPFLARWGGEFKCFKIVLHGLSYRITDWLAYFKELKTDITINSHGKLFSSLSFFFFYNQLSTDWAPIAILRCAFSKVITATSLDFFNTDLFRILYLTLLFVFSQIQELLIKTSWKMSQRKLPRKAISHVFLFLLLLSPVPAVGQFVLPFLYMPLKSLFPTSLASGPKHFKVTSEHVRLKKGWTLQETYGKIMDTLLINGASLVQSGLITASDLKDLDYSWSYTLPFNEADPSLSERSLGTLRSRTGARTTADRKLISPTTHAH